MRTYICVILIAIGVMGGWLYLINEPADAFTTSLKWTGQQYYEDGDTNAGASVEAYSDSLDSWAYRMYLTVGSAFAAADTSPSVSAGNIFSTLATPSVTIADLDDGVAGQLVIIRATDGAGNAADAGNLKLVGAWAADSANDTLTVYTADGTTWIEISRTDVD